MPESGKMKTKRLQRANRDAGIGDAEGRMPSRVKAEAKLSKCTICFQELVITKTNTELIAHAESKHGKTCEICFPGAKEEAEAMKAALQKGGKGGASNGPTVSKAEKKKKTAGAMDDLLSAGLGGGAKSKKKNGKK